MGDWRTLEVRLGDLSGFHVTDAQGGRAARLPKPALAAYMMCDVIPDGVEFGHSCRHGPPPYSFKLFIQKVDNRDTYAALRALGEGTRLDSSNQDRNRPPHRSKSIARLDRDCRKERATAARPGGGSRP